MGYSPKVHIYTVYIKYHSVCPLVGIGTPPPPLPQASMPLPPPPQPKGGGTLASKSTNERGERRPSLVGSLGPSCRYKRFLSCLGCSGQPSTNIFFFTVQYFNLRVPIAQQPGQAVVLGRLSLNVCLRWLLIFICK